jgi:2-polyprenyl-3-methyl-5-hydroxy-6-metoxy-1,4-benzoquinol methylase
VSRFEILTAMIPTQRLNLRFKDFLSQFVQNRTVLDVGRVDHSASVEREDHWLHKHLARSARSVVGLDILESDAAELRRRGYEVVCGDATTVSLNRTFDVVVAGEIIEHVDNPAAFVSNMARHLNEQGQLVMTTRARVFLSPLPGIDLFIGGTTMESPARRLVLSFYPGELIAQKQS